MAWRGRPWPFTGADLLAAIAWLAFVAGIVLALAAADLSLIGGIPLWNVALILCVLAVLASVLGFPGWWEWHGGWGLDGRACAGARARRASHPVDPHEARLPRMRPRAVRTGAHRTARPVVGGPPAGPRRRSQAEWLLASRQRGSMPRVQRQHGRQRG